LHFLQPDDAFGGRFGLRATK
jgi:hypothetical protein